MTAARVTWRQRAARALDRTSESAVLEELAGDKSEQVRLAVAMNPATPPALLLVLVDDPSDSVSSTAVHNLSADRPVWQRALAKGGPSLLHLAQVPWLPEDMAASLAQHQDWHIRRAVAESTVWRPLLGLLASDPKPEVRAAVATSQVADLELWTSLSTDPRKEVRAAVASNARVPPELLAGFAEDRSADVRWAVVSRHPHLPAIEDLFVDDDDELVRDHARLHRAAPATRTLQEDGTYVFTYPGDEPMEAIEMHLGGEDPVGAEMYRQSAEVEAKRRTYAAGPSKGRAR